MPTHGSVAKRVREDKEKHPEKYCQGDPKCLWRNFNNRPSCPKHEARPMIQAYYV